MIPLFQLVGMAFSPFGLADQPLVQVGMDNIHWRARRRTRRGRRPAEDIQPVVRNITRHVLPIPELHGIVRPETASQIDRTAVSVRSEKIGPEAWPPFIDVAVSALEGDRCREEDDRRQAGQTLDERPGGLGREMLGDFEAHGKIERPVQLERPTQVMLEKQDIGYLALRPRSPGAIYPEDVGDAALDEH